MNDTNGPITAHKVAHRGFLARLRHDTRGNTLFMMAAAMIPMAAIAGSGVDIARLYVVKSRMQQACDAGVLAGRKFMVDSSSTTLDANATTQAKTFFANNLTAGWMGTTNVSFTPTKTSDNRVAGTAYVTVPMTLTKIFKAADVRLNVVCEARYDVADTDVLFVLDTTGSMACLPADSDSTCNSYVSSVLNNNLIKSYTRPSKVGADSSSGYRGLDQTGGYAGTTGYAVPEKTGSRIAALRQAVLDFYDTMASNVQPTTNIRYGFVTYSSSANTGAAVQAVSAGYMMGGSGAGKTWNYQTRKVTDDYVVSQDSSPTYNSLTKANCTVGTISRVPAQTQAQPYTYATSNSQAVVTQQQWYTDAKKCGTVKQTVGPVWTYQQWPLDVTGYVGGTSIADPTMVDGSKTVWLGCIEERDTTAGTLTFDTKNLPPDLDPELLPTSDATRWRPLWPDVEYQRLLAYYYKGTLYKQSYTTNTVTSNSEDDPNTFANMNTDAKQKAGFVACGKPVQRLTKMTKSQVQSYVTAADFVPLGGTYHDVGMIWGTRMLATKGIFATDNAPWPGRGATNKVLVFLTDGDMSPSPYSYGLYGMEYYDSRVTDGDLSNQKAYHNARLLAECAKAQDMGIDVWTVSIADSATPEMTQCASTADQALYTTSGNGLSSAFQKIAQQVARLRLSK